MSSNPQPTDANQPLTPPPFTPQPPPKGLGVVRTLVLVLMGMIGILELLLFLGICLAHSLPSSALPFDLTSQPAPYSVQSSQALPVNAESVDPS